MEKNSKTDDKLNENLKSLGNEDVVKLIKDFTGLETTGRIETMTMRDKVKIITRKFIFGNHIKLSITHKE